MNIYKDAYRFTDLFIAYMTDRERDPVKRFQTMVLIEMKLKQVPESVARLFLGKTAQRVFANLGKDAAVELVDIHLRTKIAHEKLGYYEFGILKTKEKGDLRGARCVTNQREQLLAMMKLKIGRENSVLKYFAGRETENLDWKFQERLARVLKKPPLEFEHIDGTQLQRFLLVAWETEGRDRRGKPIPPLCCCSDPVIAKLVEFLGVQQNVTAGLVKKTWERLGLRKSSKIVVWDARREPLCGSGDRFQKIILSESRRRN